MQIVAFVVKLKIETLVSIARARHLEKEVVETLKLAGKISSQRSHADLIRTCRTSIP